MKKVLAIILVALVAPLCRAQDSEAEEVARARAKAAIELAVKQRERESIEAARVVAEGAIEKAMHDREEHGCIADYNVAYAKAHKSGKPLFIWVGMDCKQDIRSAFPDAVHVRQAKVNGSSTPRLLITYIPADQSSVDVFVFRPAEIIVERIHAALSPPLQVISPVPEPSPVIYRGGGSC
jgi:hypothetical protein